MGHSDPDKQYHYHANLLCEDAGAGAGTNDAVQCVHLGYVRDGVPGYGHCKDSSGTQFTSCYSVLSTSDTEIIETAGGGFEVVSNISDYEIGRDACGAGACNLDKGSGAI